MLEIVKLPEPKLRKRSDILDHELLLSPAMQEFIDAMIPAMYAAEGIGLASVQVAKNLRICVVGKDAAPHLTEDLILVNPAWTKNNRKTHTDHEGCLSVPKKYGKVKRYTDIHVTALNRFGKPISFDAKDFFARVIQHEVDHMEGTLFIDKAIDVYTADA